jgi:hypothetical protein
MRKAVYRIVTDPYWGFEVQYRTRLWPFWRQCGKCGGSGVNTSKTIEDAEEFARKHAAFGKPQLVIRDLGEL